MFEGVDSVSIRKIKNHLSMTSHKLYYLEKHFKNVKKERLEKECTELRVDQMARLIEEYFGRMKVKQVDASIFHTKKDVIDKEIERGEHFVESVDFLEFMCDKLTPEVQDQINKLRRQSRGDRSRRKERSHRRSRSRSKHKKRRRSKHKKLFRSSSETSESRFQEGKEKEEKHKVKIKRSESKQVFGDHRQQIKIQES